MLYNSRGPRTAARRPLPTVTVHVDRLSHDGRGIAQHKGRPVFIAGALPGETVSARIQADRRRLLEAELIEVKAAAAERVEPRCRHYAECGGCDFQYLAEDEQIKVKEQWVLEQFQRFAELKPAELAPALIGPKWHYRSRTRISLRWRGKKLAMGFRQRGSHDIVPVFDCQTLATPLQLLIQPLYDLVYGLGAGSSISHIELAAGDQGIGVLFRHLKALPESALAKLKQFAEQYQLLLLLQPQEGSDSIHCLWSAQDQAHLTYALPEFSLELGFRPSDFIQVNSPINRQMISQALTWLNPGRNDRVLDLFCGIGNFTLPLARQAATVVGVEGVESALSRARENAQANGCDNVQWHRADLDETLGQQPWARGGFDQLLLDPPRTGAREVCTGIGHLKVASLVYISCNPATLARDAKLLHEQGYTLQRLGVMDMFPHTSHVETMALFLRR